MASNLDRSKDKFAIPISGPTTGNVWRIVNYDSDIIAIHAALIANGKVLFFAGSQADSQAHKQGYVNAARYWNPQTNIVEVVPAPLDIDLFCCGHVLLGNGDLLAAGGTEFYVNDPHGRGRFTGIRNCAIFSPFDSLSRFPWRTVASMNFERETNPPRGGGRWYPTLVLLGDERVLAIGGASSSDSDYENNIMLEVFENGSPGKWIDQGRQSDVNFVGGSGDLDYPRAFLLPNGNVFVVHVYDGTIGFSHEWNPVSRAWRTYLNTPGPIYDYSPAVLLPLLPSLNYNARVLIAGGKSPKKIDLSLENPQWVDTSPRKLENAPLRLNSSAILLPDGKVLVVGGVPDKLHDESALASHTNVAELYDPSTDSWQNLAEANVIRNYHSVALLLPDGSVWTAGSNKNTDPSWKDDVGGVPNPKFDRRELRIEIYYPPYWKLIRPAISSIDNPSMSYNTPIRIFTSKTTSISSVALIRCSTATHALNPDQRFIGLVIHERDFESIIVNPPPSQNIAPPGYYMLFIIDDGNVPSPGKIVSLSA